MVLSPAQALLQNEAELGKIARFSGRRALDEDLAEFSPIFGVFMWNIVIECVGHWANLGWQYGGNGFHCACSKVGGRMALENVHGGYARHLFIAMLNLCRCFKNSYLILYLWQKYNSIWVLSPLYLSMLKKYSKYLVQDCLFCSDGGHSRQNVMTSRQFDVMTL